MPSLIVCFFLCWATLLALPLSGQLLDVAEEGSAESATRFGEPITFRFQVGAIVTAKRGACRDIRAIVAMPLPCPEQSLQLVEKDLTPNVAPLDHRELNGGAARQLLISIPFLEAGAEARALLTYEVRLRPTLPADPATTAELVVPRRVPRDLKRFVGPSPFIEARSPKIKKIVRQMEADYEANSTDAPLSDWQRVEALYDHVLDSIDYAEGPDTSALETLRDEIADCHGRSALFIALCRAAGVPARMVWVHKHCYAEFYLEDAQGEGHWFPAESAGVRAFGEMPLVRDVPLYRTILQKGDNFRVPERPRERLRYATDYLTGKPMPGSGKPTVRYVRKVVE